MNETVSQKITQLNTDRLEGIANLTQKGVTAYDTDGFSQIVSKILEIPSDKLTSVRVNNEVSYRKQVPPNSAGFCYLNSIGGMTYKGFTFDCTVQEFNGEYSAPYSFTFPKAFTFPTDDYYAFSPIVCGRTDAPIVDASALYTLSGTTMTGRGTIFNADIPVGTQLRCIPRFENQETGEYFYPPECFTDLRDAKPTAVVSYGSNLLDFEAALFYWNARYTKDGEKYTITDFGNGYSHPYVFTDKAEICTLSASESFAHIVTGVRINLGYYDGTNFTEAASLDIGGLTGTSTIAVNAIRLNYSSASSAGWYFSYSELRVNRGTTALPYSPYRAPITYTLPTAITDNLGKGCSDTIFDEYSFVDKKAITRVGEGVVDALRHESSTSKRSSFLQAGFKEMRYTSRGYYVAQAQMPFFDFGYSIHQINADGYLEYVGTIYGANLCLYVPTPLVSADVNAFISWVNSQNFRYLAELEAFTETPITLAPTDFDGLIEVEAGGYLEFVNETKDKDGNVNNYGYPVPSTVTFSLINGGGTT